MKLGLLVLTSGAQEGKLLEIKLPQFLIGRDPQCNLRPASPMISKRHCAIIVREGKAFIRDFGSTNGTYLNDERVEGEAELKNDDQLKVGPIHFAVRLEASAPRVAPKAAPSRTPLPPTKPVTKTAPTPAPAAAPAPAATPAPAAKPKFVPSGEEDVDITAMLLEMEDVEVPAGPSGSAGVPEGSTVMDLVVPPEVLAGKPPEPKGPAKPAPTGDTRSAAAKILDQMTKRPRN